MLLHVPRHSKYFNICSGFSATDILPFDADKVLSMLNTYLRTPTPPTPPPPPSSQSSPWMPETPHNIRDLERQSATIRKDTQKHTAGSNSPTNRAVQ